MSEYQDNPGPLPVLELRNKVDGGKGPLCNGSKSELVEQLQKMLTELGYDMGDSGADGKFGDDTEKAVKRFQNEHKDWGGKQLKCDGLVGSRTVDALNRAMVGVWYNEYKTLKELTRDILIITVTTDVLRKEVSLYHEDEKRAKVFLVQTGVWIDLQTVDELGHRVGNIELILVLPDGTKRIVKTDSNGYYRKEDMPAGEIRVLTADGTPAKYISGGSETDAIIHTRFAAFAIANIVAVHNLTPKELEELQKNKKLYERRRNEVSTISGRTKGLDYNTGEHTGQTSPLETRRSSHLAVDNLALAPGINVTGEVDVAKLLEILIVWLQDYQPTPNSQERGYLVLVYSEPGHQINIYDSNGKKLESLRTELEIKAEIGVYAPFQTEEGINIWKDMFHQCGYSPLVEGRETEQVLIEEIMQEDYLKKYQKIRKENPNKVFLLFHLGAKRAISGGKYDQLLEMAFHGGTGMLEPYGHDDKINANVHNRNLSVIKTVCEIYEAYIQGYVNKVKKAKHEDDLRKLGPPRSVYKFPRPLGATNKQWIDLHKLYRSVSIVKPWKAITEKLNELADRHTEGSLFFRIKLELNATPQVEGKWKRGSIGGYAGIKWEGNIDVGSDGFLKKTNTSWTYGFKGDRAPGKPLKFPIGGEVEGEIDWETEEEKITFKVKIGKWNIIEISDDGERKIMLPAGPTSIFNNRTGEFGGGITIPIGVDRELYLGLNYQGVKPDTLLAYFSHAPGFFERRSIMELLDPKTLWNELNLDEQSRLEELEWTIESWDTKHLNPIEKFPDSAVTRWDLLNNKERIAAVHLGFSREDWIMKWKEIAVA